MFSDCDSPTEKTFYLKNNAVLELKSANFPFNNVHRERLEWDIRTKNEERVLSIRFIYFKVNTLFR